MDLPASGWYPDPYATPGLLRWWDGSAWTQHTHQDEAAAGGAGSASGPQATAVQATAVQSTAVQSTAVQSTTGSLTRAKPPTGPRTEPQPALPNTAAGGTDGTQVLFLGGEGWPTSGGQVTPGGTPQYGYGYQQAQRRRRLWQLGGVAGGTAVVVAVIAILVANLGSSSATTADQTTVTPPTPTQAAATPTPASTPSPSPSPSTSASAPAATLSDGQSGLAYTQLTSPWQTGCPGALNNGAFTWTFGESAVAGQVNGGQSTWYGEACSGPLPQQYGYNGVQDLENTATNLANTFQNAYYGALNHTATQEGSQPVQISGHAGWELTYDITYTNMAGQGVTWADEQAAVVVADTGTGTAPAVFFTSIPANLGESNVAALVSSLQLTVIPQATTTPTDGGSPTDGGTPSQGGSPDPSNGPNP